MKFLQELLEKQYGEKTTKEIVEGYSRIRKRKNRI